MSSQDEPSTQMTRTSDGSILIDSYGSGVRLLLNTEEYVVQKKTGSVWKTHKAFPQSRDFAATEAREHAQALARGFLGGH